MKIVVRRNLPYFVLLLLITAASCSFSTANIESVQMAKGVGASKEPVNVTNSFDTADKEIHCVVKLASAPDNTKVKARWIAVKVEGEQPNLKIGDTDITMGSGNIDFKFSPPPAGMPPGDYKVEVYLNPDTDKGKTPAKEVTFNVKGSPAPAPAPAASPTPAPTETPKEEPKSE